MNIDGREFANACDVNNSININKNASVQVNSVESAKCAEAFFGDEVTIGKAENICDDYDRIVNETNTDKEGDMAVSPDIIKELADVVTPENYSKYEELGLEPDKDNPTQILTVSERIEIELATHCDNYIPVGDISIGDLEEVYGNTVMAYGVKNSLESGVVNTDGQVEDKININREMSAYLLVNNMPLTQDNIYMAQYSVNSGKSENYQKISDSQWDELMPQIEKLLDNTGMEITDRNLENARWLVEEKIPVTADNIFKLGQIDAINERGEYYNNISFRSIEATEIMENGTEEQITVLVLDNKDVTLLNMKRVEEDNTYKAIKERKEYNLTDRQEKQIAMSKKNLEELRLKMTTEVSVMMMKKGINIEITSLSELVEELKKAETDYADSVFAATNKVADDDKIELFNNTADIMRQFLAVPAFVLGNVIKEEIPFQVEDMVEEGIAQVQEIQKRDMHEAAKAYETLGTRPDREMGDSLNKAFGNIDSMLEGLGEETSSDNQRAVRILAYNQMEVTKENISKVREMDMQVTRLIDNLTPRTAVYLISNGINPLKTNIYELNDELDKINEEIGADVVEKYSEFLWKLDKNNQISKEDREAYIGIYRLINMVEKGDHRAVGAVIKQGKEMTMRNLLTAIRSLKHTGREVAVNDEYGVQEELKLSDNNIDNQLMRLESSVYLKRAKDIISPDNIKNTIEASDKGMDISLEQFIDKMAQEGSYNEEEEMYYNRLRSQEISDIQTISEEIFMYIAEDGTVKNMENILGISYYAMNGGRIFAKIKSACEDEEVDRDIEELETFSDSEGEEDLLPEKVNKLCEDIKKSLLNKSQISHEDMRMINRTAGYMKRAAERGTYYVPADIGGEKTTIKVTLTTDNYNKGRIHIRMNRESEDIQAQIDVSKGEAKILMSAGNEDISRLENIKPILESEFNEKGINIKSFGLMKEEMPISERNDESGVSSKELFILAKVCISCVKNCLKPTDN